MKIPRKQNIPPIVLGLCTRGTSSLHISMNWSELKITKLLETDTLEKVDIIRNNKRFLITSNATEQRLYQPYHTYLVNDTVSYVLSYIYDTIVRKMFSERLMV